MVVERAFKSEGRALGFPKTPELLSFTENIKELSKERILHFTWFYYAVSALRTLEMRFDKVSLISRLIIFEVLPCKRRKTIIIIACVPFLN